MRLPKTLPRTPGAPLLALVGLLGCSRGFTPPPAPRAPGECTFTSDCPALRVCADARCRAECRTDRDCATGLLCRPSAEPGLKVCLPPSVAELCAFTSDCAGVERCGVDHHCHGLCQADADCTGAGSCEVTTGSCTAAAPVIADGGCLACGGRCVELTSDANHCGSCENACPVGGSCVQGSCVFGACADAGPCNDSCGGATLLQLTGSHTTFAFDATGYTPSVHACGNKRDGYFRFHLDQRSFVTVSLDFAPLGVFHTGGVGFLEDCADSAPVTCGTICPSVPYAGSVTAEVLDAGFHLMVVDFEGPEATHFDVTVFPLPDGVVVDRLPSQASFNVKATGPAGAGPDTCSGGPLAHAWWAPNACTAGSNPVLKLSTCGSLAGVRGGVVDGRVGAVSSCTTNLDPNCAGAMVVQQPLDKPYPIFIFGTFPPGADGGLIQLSGSLQ